ncbi:hypothetical protein VCRA2119O147_1180012 [Vibrio crassostreae]|nr:hypothetical protein VCRA2119O381_1250009 [Vibrio crassostreae]CAK2069047.1 hypothetical protein VCRA2117O40_380011 [Vibrio crassostreae]CAK2084330.1 hypothetical protein VCRA2116O31_400011 [Vibrio crassostreae]CAK2090326.1 hypothetical protein VCRA2117O37_410011 [Vibrio crassostreae]CAK2098384.1 hypothetical protein VCRA2116O26_430002 [Vibrio crassostreae]
MVLRYHSCQHNMLSRSLVNKRTMLMMQESVVNDMDTPTQPHTYTDCVSIEEDTNHGSNNFRHRFGKIIFCFTWHRSTRLCVDKKEC